MKLAWLALAATLVTGPALAQDLLDGSDAEAILELARGYGPATLESQEDGSPLISGKIKNVIYTVFFMNCSDDAACEDLNFYAGFTDIKPTLDAINAWNREQRFGNAYLDADLDAAIEYDVNLEFGVSRPNLRAAFGVWAVILEQYVAYIGYKPE